MLATSKFGLVRSCRQGRRSNAGTMTHIYADHKKLPFHQQSKLNCGHVHTVCVCVHCSISGILEVKVAIDCVGPPSRDGACVCTSIKLYKKGHKQLLRTRVRCERVSRFFVVFGGVRANAQTLEFTRALLVKCARTC